MPKQKLTFKDIIRTIVLIGIVLFVFFLVFQLANNPIEPVTTEQVRAVLKEKGLEPEDVTQKRKEENSDVVSAIEVRNGDFYFTYISLSDNKKALKVSQILQSHIKSNRYSATNIEVVEFMANYHIYTITVKERDEYTVCVLVGNTVIYAESNINNSYIIKKIMSEIGYFR